MNIGVRCAIILSLLWPLTAGAEEGPRTMVRAHLEPAGEVVVGQPVKLVLDVLVTTWFMRAPEFPMIDIPGALVTVPDEQSVHLTEQIDGVTWFGLTHTYVITPMEPRAFTVPRGSIVLYPGLAPGPVKVWSPARTFHVKVPAGAEGVAIFLATSHLDMAQQFDRKLTGLRVGDSLTRTITLTAHETQAMFLPPVTFADIQGLAIYPGQPKVDNIVKERKGFMGGRRTESATYVIQQAGHYELPPVTVEWWDLKAGRLREHRLPPVSFGAVPNPGYRPEIAVPIEATAPDPVHRLIHMQAWAWLSAGVLLCALAVRFLGPNIRQGVRTFLSRRAERRRLYERSEAAAFERLQEAAHHDDAGQTVQRLYQWLDRCKTVAKPARLEQAVITSRDDHFKEAVGGLLDRQFGLSDATQSSAWPADFEGALRQARKRVNADDRARGSGASVLQPLNPE